MRCCENRRVWFCRCHLVKQVLPPHCLQCHPPCHAYVMLPNLTNPEPAVLSLCLFHRFSPQSHSGGSSNVQLGITSFVQKGRSMFPKVLLQWCAALSSCAAEIGKPFHGSTTFVCLLCQQASCAIRLCCYNPKPCVGLRPLSGLLCCRVGVAIK